MKKTDNHNILDTAKAKIMRPPKDGDFDHLARLASEVLNAPFVMILLNDFDKKEDRTSNVKIDGQELQKKLKKNNVTLSMSCRAYLAGGLLEKDPEAIKKVLWENDDLKFCANAPLTSQTGQQLGTLYAFDKSGKLWGNVHWEILDVIAKTIVKQLETQLAANRILKATNLPVDGEQKQKNAKRKGSHPNLESHRLAPRPAASTQKTRKTIVNQGHYREARWGS